MKFVLLLLLVLIGVLLWRTKRPAATRPDPNQPPSQPAPEALDMVRCTWCAVHVPVAEAVQGKNGPYCCPDHRRQAES